GRETTLFHQLTARSLGQEGRRQRPIPSGVRLEWQTTDTHIRVGLHRAQARPAAPHAVWLDQDRELNCRHLNTLHFMNTSLFRACMLATGLACLSGTSTLLAEANANSSRTPDHDYDPPAPGSYTLPVIKAAADGEVLDDKGRSRRLVELTRGRVTV